MTQNNMLLPLLAMVALTIAVWVRLYIERIGEMRARHIKPQEISTSRQIAARLEKTNASDNFKNLLEVPVLFHVFCLTTYVAQASTPVFIACGWLYVGLRVMHSFIHCTYNNANHRFAVYAASTLLLFYMWGALGVALLSARSS